MPPQLVPLRPAQYNPYYYAVAPVLGNMAYNAGRQAFGQLIPRTLNYAAGQTANYLGRKARRMSSNFTKSKGLRKYMTTGSISKRYKAKKVSKKKLKKQMNFAKNGSSKTVENGGTYTVGGQETMYIGHGPAVAEVWDAALRAVMKELMKQAKLHIDHWDEAVEFPPVVDSLKILYTFIANPAVSSATVDGTISIVSPDTYQDVNTKLKNAIAASIGASYGAEFVYFRLYQTDAASADSTQLAKINVKDFMLRYEFKSYMRLQNQTLANTLSDDLDAMNVANNPIIGKLYEGTMRLNGFRWSTSRPLPMANTFIADKASGIIKAKSSTDVTTILAKPPPGWWFGTKKVRTVKENPGAVFENRIYTKQSISFNRLVQELQTFVNDATHQLMKFGQCSMFGLEKMLDSGRSTGEDIKIGYELAQTYNCAGKYTERVKSAPIIYIGTAAI